MLLFYSLLLFILTFSTPKLYYTINAELYNLIKKNRKYELFENIIYQNNEVILIEISIGYRIEKEKVNLDQSIFEDLKKFSSYKNPSYNWLAIFLLKDQSAFNKLKDLLVFIEKSVYKNKSITFFALLPEKLLTGEVVCYAYFELTKQMRGPGFRSIFNNNVLISDSITMPYYRQRPIGVSSSDLVDLMKMMSFSLSKEHKICEVIFHGKSRNHIVVV